MQTLGQSEGRQSSRSDVKILLADDKPFMRQVISNALSYGGFRDICPVNRLADLAELLGSAFPDLLIIDCDLPDGDAARMVQDIRLHNLGRNPFVPIVMTIWDADRRAVRRIIEHGVDALLVKPFAAGQLIDRIDRLAAYRKRFIATTDYVGPNRHECSRGGDLEFFDPPNTLRDKIKGRPVNLSQVIDNISSAVVEMREARARALADSISRLTNAIISAAPETENPARRQQIVNRLIIRCETLGDQIPETRYLDLQDQVRSLTGAARVFQHECAGLPREQLEAMVSLSDAIRAGTRTDRLSGSCAPEAVHCKKADNRDRSTESSRKAPIPAHS